jgi:hypothetical protein
MNNHLFTDNRTGWVVDNEIEIEWFIDTEPDIDMAIRLADIQVANSGNNSDFEQNALMLSGLVPQTLQFEVNYFIHENLGIKTEFKEIHISEEEKDCVICFEKKEKTDISQINCGHKFCVDCVIHHIHVNKKKSCCPLCRANIVRITFPKIHCLDI